MCVCVCVCVCVRACVRVGVPVGVVCQEYDIMFTYILHPLSLSLFGACVPVRVYTPQEIFIDPDFKKPMSDIRALSKLGRQACPYARRKRYRP